MTARNSRAHYHGFSLIEVLVALVVLAVGLLGLAGLQSTGLKLNDSSLNRTQAQIATGALLERVRANRETITNFSTGGNFVDPDTFSTSFAPLDEWLDEQVARLPGGTAQVDCQADGQCDVDVQWNDQRGEANTADADSKAVNVTFNTQTEV